MIYLEQLIQAVREHKKGYNIQWPELPEWYQKYNFRRKINKKGKNI